MKSRLPTDQVAHYEKSVHAEALMKKNDLSAPTCNDCHGNHGASPPGVSSVANVCGTCHTRQAEMFRQSPHNASFQALGQGECVVCHQNHEIRGAIRPNAGRQGARDVCQLPRRRRSGRACSRYDEPFDNHAGRSAERG